MFRSYGMVGPSQLATTHSYACILLSLNIFEDLLWILEQMWLVPPSPALHSKEGYHIIDIVIYVIGTLFAQLVLQELHDQS